MNKQEERTGTIVEIIFRNEENGYTVAVMETDTEYFTVVGNLPRCLKGARFRLTGSFREHPSYGEQFVFREFEEILPEEKSAIFDFLSSGAIKGVGPVTAAALVAAFGDETLNVIETEPGRLTEVKGVGEKTAATPPVREDRPGFPGIWPDDGPGPPALPRLRSGRRGFDRGRSLPPDR